MTPAGGTLTKKKLTVSQAADQWVKARKAIDRNKPLLDEAAEVLEEHFEKTGKTTYKDLIAYVTNTPRTVWKTEELKKFLGKRLPEFRKKTKPSKSLTLLDPD